jgi:hypothetical protein
MMSRLKLLATILFLASRRRVLRALTSEGQYSSSSYLYSNGDGSIQTHIESAQKLKKEEIDICYMYCIYLVYQLE